VDATGQSGSDRSAGHAVSNRRLGSVPSIREGLDIEGEP
jgi:hypothetical protein